MIIIIIIIIFVLMQKIAVAVNYHARFIRTMVMIVNEKGWLYYFL